MPTTNTTVDKRIRWIIHKPRPNLVCIGDAQAWAVMTYDMFLAIKEREVPP